MKYFIVSEKELEHAFDLMYELGNTGGIYSPLDELHKATAACRSRPVPEWAKLFVDAFPDASNVERIDKEDKR